MGDMVWWNGHWYPLALENDGTSSNQIPDAHHLPTTTLPHLLGNIDKWFPCACACPAMEETEDTQPDYLEKLGWQKGIGNDSNEEAISLDQQRKQDKKVHFNNKIDVVNLECG